MKIKEFLSDTRFHLPLKRKIEDFYHFAKTILSDYLESIKLLWADYPQILLDSKWDDLVAPLCKNLLETIREYLNGDIYNSYKTFITGITPLQSHLKCGRSFNDIEVSNLLYRVRRDIKKDLSVDDMFHIPFEERTKVGSQRYSIPGLPCLYLGGSIYDCWAEMDYPPFHELQVSAFKVKKGLKLNLINLNAKPQYLLNHLERCGVDEFSSSDNENFANQLIWWPLIALSSIIVKEREHPFKPEYIIPQFTLQWIKENKFDGIIYPSTRVLSNSITGLSHLNCNFVFPVKSVQPIGHCPNLRDLFHITKPQKWELLRAIGCLTPQFHNKHQYEFFDFIANHNTQYFQTEFGQIESSLEAIVESSLS